MLKIQESTSSEDVPKTILVVQSSPKIKPLQELSFPLALHVKLEESAKPMRFRLTLKLELAHHLATIARN